MKYKGKRVEVISSKMLFGKETAWIHILEDNTFEQVLCSDLEEEMTSSVNSGMAYIRNAKMRKLQTEKENWQNAFAKGRSVVPDVKHILTVRING